MQELMGVQERGDCVRRNLFLQRQRSNPNPPRPLAKSGKVAGTGVAVSSTGGEYEANAQAIWISNGPVPTMKSSGMTIGDRSAAFHVVWA